MFIRDIHNTVIIICKNTNKRPLWQRVQGQTPRCFPPLLLSRASQNSFWWDWWAKMGQVSPSATKADSSALRANCELKSSLCGAERSICPLSSGLKMNLIFKREDKGWGTGWVYWGNISMASGEVKAVVRKQWEEEISWQSPDIYLDF